MEHTDSMINTEKDKSIITALYKERWVNISVQYDEFWKFVFQFLMPLLKITKEEEMISSFYYKIAYAHKNVIQLTFKVSPFDLERQLKPVLFKSLNAYYNEQYFTISSADLGKEILTRKDPNEVFDVENFKLLGLEEYYIDAMAYVIGRQGAKELLELSAASADIILDNFQKAGENIWTIEDSIENSLSFHCAVLHIFLSDRTEIYHFLAWVASSMLDNLRKLEGVVDLLDWKFNAVREMETNFENCKGAISGYIEYVLETLVAKDEFEEGWLNQWISDCSDCRNKLAILESAGKLSYNDNAVKEDMTVFHNIDNETFKKWKIVYSILRTVNGQLGITLNYYLELDFFYSMKQSFKTLSIEETHKIEVTP